MKFLATIGNDGHVMDVSAPDLPTAVAFVKSEAKGKAFTVQTEGGSAWHSELSEADMKLAEDTFARIDKAIAGRT